MDPRDSHGLSPNSLDRVAEFLEENGDLDRDLSWGSIQFAVEGGRLVLLLRLREHATIDAIRRDWPLIADWKSRLLSFQGSSPGDSLKSMWRMVLDHRQSRGESYKRIADQTNTDLVEELWYVVYYGLESGQGTSSSGRVDPRKESSSGAQSAWWAGLEAQVAHLKELGIEEADAREWCASIMDELTQIVNLTSRGVIDAEQAAAKRARLATGGLVTDERIRASVRARRGRKRGKHNPFP